MSIKTHWTISSYIQYTSQPMPLVLVICVNITHTCCHLWVFVFIAFCWYTCDLPVSAILLSVNRGFLTLLSILHAFFWVICELKNAHFSVSMSNTWGKCETRTHTVPVTLTVMCTIPNSTKLQFYSHRQCLLHKNSPTIMFQMYNWIHRLFNVYMAHHWSNTSIPAQTI